MKKDFLIGIRVRKDCPQAMESQIGIAALFGTLFFLLQMLKELHMNWSSEWLLQENPQLSNQSRLPFLLMRHECLLLVEAKMPNVFEKSLWGRSK